jgi:pimeloyl-ACP methyl ester carboxylesterase
MSADAVQGRVAVDGRETAEERFRRLQDAVLAGTGTSVTSRFVDVRTPRLRVQLLEAGAGDPVVMIHGGNGFGAHWAPVISNLAPGFRLLMPDRPGCGLTSAFSYRGVDLRRHGVEYVEGLLDALGLERASLVGNSMGGFFEMAFAIAHPERVSKLVLVGEPAGASGRVDSRYHKLVGTMGINSLLFRTVLRPPIDTAGVRAGLAKGRLMVDPGRLPEPLAEAMVAGAQLPGATRAWYTMLERAFDRPGLGIAAHRTVLTHALIPDLGRLSAPTLFLWGDQDPLGTPDDGREVARHMPNARVQVVEDASHLAWLDQPDVVAASISGFLAE